MTEGGKETDWVTFWPQNEEESCNKIFFCVLFEKESFERPALLTEKFMRRPCLFGGFPFAFRLIDLFDLL